MSGRYTVFIPLVNPANDAVDHDLLEVYSDPYEFSQDIDQFLKQELKSINKGWERITVRLRAINLQASAHVAVEAVRKLNLKTPRWAIYQWFKPQAWLERQRLGPSNPIKVSEGDSAELGLALVLLSSAGGSKETQIIATGKLRAQGPKSHDVEVLPVAGVPEKLQFLLEQQLNGHLPDKPLLCFTPTHFLQNDFQLGNILDLPEVASLKEYGIQIIPISWLSEAIPHLQIKSTRIMPADQGLMGALFFVLFGALIWCSYHYWLWREIPLDWVAPASMEALPFQVCINGENIIPYPLDNNGGKSIIASEATMAWYVKRRDNFIDFFDSKIKYYAVNILFGEVSGILIKENTENSPLFDINMPYHSSFSLSDKEEDRVLVVLVSRMPINTSDLENEFNQRFQPNLITHTFQPSSAADYFMKKAPGRLRFAFTQNKKVTNKCDGNDEQEK